MAACYSARGANEIGELTPEAADNLLESMRKSPRLTPDLANAVINRLSTRWSNRYTPAPSLLAISSRSQKTTLEDQLQRSIDAAKAAQAEKAASASKAQEEPATYS